MVKENFTKFQASLKPEWASLSASQKEPYEKLAQLDKERYYREKQWKEINKKLMIKNNK